MKSTIKKSALAFAALKSGQQVLHDLDNIILDNTNLDIARYGSEEIFRISAAGAAAYAIDKGASYIEELIAPKVIRGALAFTAATVGVGALTHYFGEYMNMEQTTGLIEATKQVANNYQDNLVKLVTFDSSTHAGYLTGAAVALSSGIRFCKNIGEKIAYHAEKKKLERRQKELQELADTKNNIQNQKDNKNNK